VTCHTCFRGFGTCRRKLNLLCRVEEMQSNHFALATAQTKIRKFFQDASARPDSAGGDDADTEGDSGEFGCVREGELLTGLCLLTSTAKKCPGA